MAFPPFSLYDWAGLILIFMTQCNIYFYLTHNSLCDMVLQTRNTVHQYSCPLLSQTGSSKEFIMC